MSHCAPFELAQIWLYAWLACTAQAQQSVHLKHNCAIFFNYVPSPPAQCLALVTVRLSDRRLIILEMVPLKELRGKNFGPFDGTRIWRTKWYWKWQRAHSDLNHLPVEKEMRVKYSSSREMIVNHMVITWSNKNLALHFPSDTTWCPLMADRPVDPNIRTPHQWMRAPL